MPTPWTRDQVMALAPDPASAKAGQGLASATKWAAMGRQGDALWGECRGSGAAPYQTKLDLAEPAFHCSCPSRKFPCKHVLGLFLIYAGGPAAIAEADPPAWVASWLEGRAKRAEQKAQKEKAQQEKEERGEPAADPEARRKREAARAAKVGAGLDELGTWLGDLVRGGLATLPARPADLWDERSRRLVDAQAPGAARRVLRLGALPTSGDGWHDAILEQLGRLHLLVEGHRRLDALPAEVQAEVRTAVGYPVDQDEVRAGPAVRDTWAVITQRVVPDVQDARLRVRRTWLRGESTGRPALVLDFAHAQQPLDVSLVPGTTVVADLAFFPGNLPLRALVKERHGVPGTLAALAGQATIAGAMAAYAGALARNPWLDAFPIVLEQVVLVPGEAGWSVRDASGAALPVAPRFDRGWHLLAVGGGGPMALAGEYDGEAFEPLSARVGGRFRVVRREADEARPTGPPPVGAQADLAASWREAAACALVGLDRRTPALAAADDPLHRLARGLAGDAPARLLGFAAAASLSARAGRRPAIDPAPAPEPCGADDLPECGPEPARRLARLLGGEFPEVLPEWLDLLARAGRRLPDELLPDVLTLGRTRSEIRDLMRPVLGTRGRWLAARNPEWAYVGGEADRRDPAEVWQTGMKAERVVALKTLRRTDPDRARELLESTWKAEPADERLAFIEALAVGISMADEPLLEAALDDRSKSVRPVAARLLAGLPDSRLARRMAERAARCVRWEEGSLTVSPPKECDAEMARDGIEPKPVLRMGERAWWLRGIVASTPLRNWVAAGATPGDLVAAIRKGEWRDALWSGWADAALRARDPTWAEALYEGRPEKSSSISIEGYGLSLLEVLPRERREELILRDLTAGEDRFNRDDPAFVLIRNLQPPVGEELAREALRRVRAGVEAGSGGKGPRAYDHAFASLVRHLGGILPPSLADEAARGWVRDGDDRPVHAPDYDALLDRLRFRSEMHRELAP